MNKKVKQHISMEKESEEWYNEFLELINKGDEEGVFNLLQQAKNIYLNEHIIYRTIQCLVSEGVDSNERERLIKELEKYSFIKEIKYTDSAIMIKVFQNNIENDIYIYKLSDVFHELKEEGIETPDRHGKCRSKSIDISSRLKYPSDVVTGYIYGASDKGKYSHTWVECGEKREYVMDYTMNAVMKKEGYYFLRHAEPIARISDIDIKEDIKRFGYFADCSDILEYLLFREEKIKQIEEKIFER